MLRWQIALTALLAESVATAVATVVVGWPVLLVGGPLVLATAIITLVFALVDAAERRAQAVVATRFGAPGAYRRATASAYVGDHGSGTGADSWSDHGWSSAGGSADSWSDCGSWSDSGSSSSSSSSAGSDSSC